MIIKTLTMYESMFIKIYNLSLRDCKISVYQSNVNIHFVSTKYQSVICSFSVNLKQIYKIIFQTSETCSVRGVETGRRGAVSKNI